MRAAIVLAGLLVLTAAPAWSQTLEEGGVSEVALTLPHEDSGIVIATPAKKPRQTTHATAARPAKKPKLEAAKSKAMVPRTTFEERTARYFDPLALTLAPETRLDPEARPYNPLDGSFTPVDRGQVAVITDDPTTHDISSAGIEQMGKGNNHTVVVPLFQVLNSLSPGPAQQ